MPLRQLLLLHVKPRTVRALLVEMTVQGECELPQRLTAHPAPHSRALLEYGRKDINDRLLS